ncbi:MAG: carboxyl transferase domain-containing protein [Clostridia bacterium]|nr:carboxyl transferase domain-containing protein [Clostridia bacterium]
MSIESKTEALATARAEISATKAYERLSKLFDDGAFTEIDTFVKSADSYAEVVAAYGYVNGAGVYAFAQNSDIAGGAMSKAQAAKIKKVYDLALKTGAPVVALYDSVGGRLTEGSELLAAYGDVLKYSNNLSGVVPQISVVLGKCFGTQALIAACADVVVMSEKAEFSLETSGANASATENAKHGTAHIVTKSEDEAISKTKDIIALLPSNNLEVAAGFEFDEPVSAPTTDTKAAEAINAVVDSGSAVELQAEYGKAVKTVLATVTGDTVGVVATADSVLDSKSCSKAARFIRFCDAFGIPVITFVDAQKFECIKSAAKLTSAYAEATTAKITVITGDAYGAVYIATAGTGAAADITFAWPTASVSALNPEAAAVIMLGDDFGGKLKKSKDPKADKAAVIAEYKDKNCSALDAAANGYVEDIINPEETRAKIIASLELLSGKRVSTLPKKHNNLYI